MAPLAPVFAAMHFALFFKPQCELRLNGGARGLISPSGGESELLSSLCISCAEAAAVPAQLGMRVMQSKMMRTERAAS